MEPKAESDRDLLIALGPRHRAGDGEILGGTAAGANKVLLLTRGSADLAVESPFGPHRIATLEAPVLLNLGRELTGASDPSLIVSAAESEAVELSSDQVRELLVSPSYQSQAFRRLALASVTQVVRATNRALARFFEDDTAPLADTLKSGTPELAESQQAVPVSTAKIRDLLDAAGLSLVDLPRLGLRARRIAAGSLLVRAGTKGTEAYLLGEGHLRVLITIPGVGAESLTILGPGEMVGEMALVDDEPRSADVIADGEPALVYVLSRPVFRYLLTSGTPKGAPLLAGITIILSRRAGESLKRVAAFRVLAGPG